MQDSPPAALDRKWSKPSQLSKHLSCSICDEVFTNPRRITCSHTFCEKCILQWFNNQKTCPQCRKAFKLKDLGKDLIAEKIINDLEVFCVNDKYCKWKDRLELLPRHFEVCEFRDKNLTDWLQGFENLTQYNNTKASEDQLAFLGESELVQERISNEVPKAPLLARLYAKDESSKALFKGILNPGMNPGRPEKKAASEADFEFLEGFLNSEDLPKGVDLNQTKELVLTGELDAKIMIISDSNSHQDETLLQESEKEEKKSQDGEETKNKMGEEEVVEVRLGEGALAKKRKYKEPALCSKLKQIKS